MSKQKYRTWNSKRPATSVLNLWKGGKPERDHFKAELLKELAHILHKKHWEQEQVKTAVQLIVGVLNLPAVKLDEVYGTLKKEGNKVAAYMNALEKRGFKNGFENGFENGVHDHAVQSAMRLLAKNVTHEVIALGVALPLDEVEDLDRRRLAGEFPNL